MTVSREKSEAKCYLSPLPDNVPKPADLKTGLQMSLAQSGPSGDNVIVRKYWAVREQVDKTLLRQEVQDFCGQFPAFQLQEVDLNSATGLDNTNVGRTRLERKVDPTKLPFCDKATVPDMNDCNPDDWIFSFEIRDGHCTYWLIDPACTLNKQNKNLCEKWKHLYNSMICYTVVCPP